MELAEKVKRVNRPDKSFIFSAKSGDLFELNEIGNFIIDKILQNKTQEEIIENICEETGETKEVVKVDVIDFLTALREKKFLK